MALSRTLIRAYAIDYALRYSQTFMRQIAHLIQTVNIRILTDTQSDQFVTLFFGVLDPHTGSFAYVNAGHNAPYLFPRHRGRRSARTPGAGSASRGRRPGRGDEPSRAPDRG